MAPRRARFYTTEKDERCLDTRKFIEDAGVLLDVRDIEKNPLSVDELSALYGYCDMSHFIDKMSEAYAEHGLDKKLPERDKLLELMAADYSLIRRPIIKSTRLMMVGCDKKKIAEMLQIGQNGTGDREQPRRSHRQKRAEPANFHPGKSSSF